MADDADSGDREIEPFKIPDCSHYSRGCYFVSPCCGKRYGCRLCHDEKELSHAFDRYAVKEVECGKCHTTQPVSSLCSECGIQFGKYYCSVCHLYDNVDKGQFHCNKCGLCRIGGKEKYFHCDTCGFCLDKSMLEKHRCRQDNSKNNCPVCMEDIHTARDPAHVPDCGHLLHMSCYQGMAKKGMYQCPLCQTSLHNMKRHWQSADLEISKWEMPPHLKNFKVTVNCRDCQQKTDTSFHILGLKCMSEDCGSYNTVRCGNEEIPEDAVPVRAEEFAEYLQQRQQEQQGVGEEEQGEGQEEMEQELD